MDIGYMPDPHAKPEVDNSRFSWAGNFFVDRKPEVIVLAGDWFDFSSLSHFDRGKLKFEGRRYVKDIEAGIDALDKFTKPFEDYNRTHKKKYNPRIVVTLGNHEYRLIRAVEENAVLEGTISEDDMQWREYGIEVVPFKEVVMIEGIGFTHYFPNGLMDKAIGGVSIGRSILAKIHHSGFQGHSHILSVDTQVSGEGRRMWGGSLGWWGEHEEDYVSPTTQKTWWSGLTILRNVEDGDCDPEFTSMKSIKRMY